MKNKLFAVLITLIALFVLIACASPAAPISDNTDPTGDDVISSGTTESDGAESDGVEGDSAEGDGAENDTMEGEAVESDSAESDGSEVAYYFVVNYDVTNMEMYTAYLEQTGAVLVQYGGTPLVIDNNPNDIEGSSSEELIVLRFDSEDAFNQWYNSPEYQEIVHLRLDSTEGWGRGAAEIDGVESDGSEVAYYFVVNYDVTNMEMYTAYLEQTGAVLMQYGGTPLVIDNNPNDVEGSSSEDLIVLRFDSEDAFNQWYNSPEYQEIVHLRLDSTEGWGRGAAQFALPS